MRLEEVMRRRVLTAAPEETAGQALERMRLARIHHLVVQEGPNVLGILSDRDIANLGERLRTESVGSCMTAPAAVAAPETTIRQAANLMRGRSIGCLPVVEKGRLAGIVTTTDLLTLIGRGAERPVAKGRRAVMKGRGPRRKPVSATGRAGR
jgi:acetoin utilization protein AcuB